MEHTAPVAKFIEVAPDLMQVILDDINTYREPSTPPYESLLDVSDARIRYWVQYELEERKHWPDTFNSVKGFQQIDAILEVHGVQPTSEGWGFIRFGCVTKDGIFNIRDTR